MSIRHSAFYITVAPTNAGVAADSGTSAAAAIATSLVSAEALSLGTTTAEGLAVGPGFVDTVGEILGQGNAAAFSDALINECAFVGASIAEAVAFAAGVSGESVSGDLALGRQIGWATAPSTRSSWAPEANEI